MSEVSDYLNSQSDIYYFNVFVKDGFGVFKFPYTSTFSETLSISFRKLEYMPYKVDGYKSYVKNLFRYGETRQEGTTVSQPKLLDDFLTRMKSLSGTQTINVISFYNLNIKAKRKEDRLFTVDYIIVTNELLTKGDSVRMLDVINLHLRERGSNKFLHQDFDFLNLATYPDWLLKPDIGTDEESYYGYTGIMFSSYKLKLQNFGKVMFWLIGNLDTSFKIRTDMSIESVVNVNLGEITSASQMFSEDVGFVERVTQTKYRGFNYNICKACVSSEQVIKASANVGTDYVLDAFGVVGNLMIHFNRIFINKSDLTVNLETLSVDKNVILEGSPYIIINLSDFKNLGDVNASINFDTLQKVDPNVDIQYIRITSEQAYKASVLSQGRFVLDGVLYQGASSYEAISPYMSNFVTCYRTPESNELKFKLQVFTNSNFIFGDEVYENSSGLLVGEIVLLHSHNRIVNNFF